MTNNNTDIKEQFYKIRKDFFCYRNGMVSEQLKSAYPMEVIIYGLTVPQFKEIAEKFEKNIYLCKMLWNDLSCRESRLISLFLLPIKEVDKESALSMLKSVRSNEEAELLAFKVLKFLSFAHDLCNDLINDRELSDFSQYCLQMLQKNLLLNKS